MLRNIQHRPFSPRNPSPTCINRSFNPNFEFSYLEFTQNEFCILTAIKGSNRLQKGLLGLKTFAHGPTTGLVTTDQWCNGKTILWKVYRLGHNKFNLFA